MMWCADMDCASLRRACVPRAFVHTFRLYRLRAVGETSLASPVEKEALGRWDLPADGDCAKVIKAGIWRLEIVSVSSHVPNPSV